VLRARENRKFDDLSWYRFGRHQNLDKQEYTKIAVPRLIDRLKAIYDKNGEYYLDNVDVNGILLKTDSSYGPEYLLALLNSRLMDFLFKKGSVKFRGEYYSANKQFIAPLPIARISFATPEKERKEFFAEAVQLYCASKLDEVLKWAEYELALKRNDTVHDFLVYLAEQMIEMNKKKNEEIKGFLKWLEREIGTEIEGLTNKTAIKEYHDNDFNHLLDVLKKNKNKITTDPSARKTQELLETNFAKSMTVLSPLKARLMETDILIDHIVYKLYALSPEEIAIVEGKR